MANINVRAKDKTIEKLKDLCERTGESQGGIIEKAIDLLDDLVDARKVLDEQGSLDDTFALVMTAKLLLNKVK